MATPRDSTEIANRVIWVGPFGVSQNGISDYAHAITQNWVDRLDVSMLKLHFSNWQRNYPLQLARVLAALRRASKADARPLVHLQYCPYSTGPGSAFVAIAARALGMRVVTTIHEDRASGLGSRSSLYQKAYPPFEAAVFRLSDAFVVHSEYHLARLPERVRSRARIIEFGTMACEAELGQAAETATVGCFGIIAPYKGIETVIEASAVAAKRVAGLRLLIAGAVPPSARQRAYFADLSRFAADRLGDAVEIRPNLGPQDFDGLYHRSRVIGFGFQRVNQSTTFHKALEHIKPVVATNVGGVGELTARENMGRVVAVGDSAAMAAELEELLGDPDAYSGHQTAISDYLKRRSWSENSNEHVGLYASVLAA